MILTNNFRLGNFLIDRINFNKFKVNIGFKTVLNKMDDEPGASNETSNELYASEDNSKPTSYQGGRNCCVPHCGNNSCRNHLLSFH